MGTRRVRVPHKGAAIMVIQEHGKGPHRETFWRALEACDPARYSNELQYTIGTLFVINL